MIGIFGGTFDPVHSGHLRVVQTLSRELPFDELRLLPCGEPAHRAPPQASVEDRVAMLRLAIEGKPTLLIDDREVRRHGPSYMVDTLVSLREELGEIALVLIIGWDAFMDLPTWQHWQELLLLAHLLVVQRPGSVVQPCAEVSALLQRCQVETVAALQAVPAGCILLYPLDDALAVSSTEIRELIARREAMAKSESIVAEQDADLLLPAAVWGYIKEHNLYLK